MTLWQYQKAHVMAKLHKEPIFIVEDDLIDPHPTLFIRESNYIDDPDDIILGIVHPDGFVD